MFFSTALYDNLHDLRCHSCLQHSYAVQYMFHHMSYKCMEIHVVFFKEKDRINKTSWQWCPRLFLTCSVITSIFGGLKQLDNLKSITNSTQLHSCPTQTVHWNWAKPLYRLKVHALINLFPWLRQKLIDLPSIETPIFPELPTPSPSCKQTSKSRPVKITSVSAPSAARQSRISSTATVVGPDRRHFLTLHGCF